MAEQATEQAVLEVLREVVGNTEIGPLDDFYLVGGHSLLIVPITRRLRVEYAIELDPRAFASTSQVAGLIEACRAMGEA